MKQLTIFTTIILTLMYCSPCITFSREIIKADIKNKPQYFLENKGQITDQYNQPRVDIDFKLNSHNIAIYIGNGQMHYQWTKEIQQSNAQPRAIFDDELPESSKNKQPAKVEMYRLDISLLGANKNAVALAGNPTGYKENYYLPQCPDGIKARAYSKVTYKNIYPNIDWVIYTNSASGSGIKYDFIIHPGGKVSDIQIQYNGTTELQLQNGSLIATTPYGSITENQPFTYHADDKSEINSGYNLNGNVLSFNVAPYEGTIVIDPTVDWASYYGGPGGEGIGSSPVNKSIAVDKDANIYIAGNTNSTTNIATIGSFQTTVNGPVDVFVIKLNAGGYPIWGTYFGGIGDDLVSSLVTSNYAGIYICGSSEGSNSLPTANAYQKNNAGRDDGFIARFDSSGNRIWCTYYGKDLEDEFRDVVTDAQDNVYAVGYIGRLPGSAISAGNLVTQGCHQDTMFGLREGLMVKFDSSGNRIWASMYGSEWNDYLNSISLDKYENLYIVGNTTSQINNNRIATVGAFQDTIDGGSDCMIAKFDTSGRRIWGTFYGGNGHEIASGTCDSFGNIYVAGWTGSSTNMASSGAHQSYNATTIASWGSDCFIARFDSSGQRVWGTFYGGNRFEQINSIAIGNAGDIYLTGQTNSTNNIATTGAIQSSYSGGTSTNTYYDALFAIFSPNGKLEWATYFGDTLSDYFHSSVYGPDNNIYAYGNTQSTTGIATLGSYQTSLSGYSDNFIVNFKEDTAVYIPPLAINHRLCAGDNLKVPVKVKPNMNFKPGNQFKVQLSDSSGGFSSGIIIGSKTSSSNDTISCLIPANMPFDNRYRIRVIATNPIDTSYDNNYNLWISPYPVISVTSNSPLCVGETLQLNVNTLSYVDTFSWSGPVTSLKKNLTINGVQTTHSGNYIMTANFVGCKTSDTVKVIVHPIPGKPSITANTPLCDGDTLKLSATSSTNGANYIWWSTAGLSSSIQNPIIINTKTSHTGKYFAQTEQNGCYSPTDSLDVLVKQTPTPTLLPNSPICENGELNISVTDVLSNVVYNWSGPSGFTSTSKDLSLKNLRMNQSGKYIIYASSQGCSSTNDIDINITPLPGIITTSDNSPICANDTLLLYTTDTSTNVNYTWSGPDAYSSSDKNPAVFPVSVKSSGNYVVTANRDGCTIKDSTTITVKPLPEVPKATSNSPVYVDDELQLQILNPQSGVDYLWNGPDSFQSHLQNPVLTATEKSAGSYTLLATLEGCISGAVTVVIIAQPFYLPEYKLFPNPNNGNITLQGETTTDNIAEINISDAAGKNLYRKVIQPENKQINTNIRLAGRLSSGDYLLNLKVDGRSLSFKFTVFR